MPILKEIGFGDGELKDICWKLRNNENFDHWGDEKIQQYTSLFKEKWKNRMTSWNESTSSVSGWKVNCDNPRWIILNEDQMKNILGICGEDKTNKTLFVEKSISYDKKTSNLKVCVQKCFKNENNGILKISNVQNWAEMVFYTKTKEK